METRALLQLSCSSPAALLQLSGSYPPIYIYMCIKGTWDPRARFEGCGVRVLGTTSRRAARRPRGRGFPGMPSTCIELQRVASGATWGAQGRRDASRDGPSGMPMFRPYIFHCPTGLGRVWAGARWRTRVRG